EVLLKAMSSINMDTQRKMTNVMLLIFEKTISEPNFAPTYARFCKVLFHEIKAENKSLFTSSLITRIQHEFESNVNDANAKAKKLQPTQERINACQDTAKKIELRAEMEDLEYQFRRRAWGTVRFIGELFKLQSLTSDRVLHCVESLLEHGCEEKLEYMCKLLTTVGHLLEAGPSEQYQSGARIEKIFRRIQDIVQRSRGGSTGSRQHQFNIKISSRVRFMMQDVLDLRSRNWDQPVTAHSTSGSRQRHKQHEEPKTQQQQQHSTRGSHLPQQQQQQSNYQYQQQKQHHHHHGYNDGGNYFMQKLPKTQQHENQSWTYVFEFLGPIMHEGGLELKDIWQPRWLEDPQFTERFVRAFVSYFVQEFGAVYTHKLWHIENKLDRGQLFWSDARKYRDFLQSNSFQFLEPNSTATVGMQRQKVTRTQAEHVERISYLLRLSSDTAIDYINTNVHINASFVRHLTKFLCCDFALINESTKKNNNNNNHNTNKNKLQLQLNVDSFRRDCTPLLRLCIDAQETHEMACIEETVDALQEHFSLELDDEMAAGEAICSAWSVLYDCEVISRDTFEKWFKQEFEHYPRALMDKLRAFIEEM
ncbi:PREDICTED: uncharacterized protein LOC108620462, partial [Drosophila arizonae]|uniref:Uncharacterized protein LOC108620462 n=1 Tax=Drosophila arizonae TaxID=7263 RepID=A0ABM1Q069_DROAR